MGGMNEVHLTPKELATRWHMSHLTLKDYRTDGNGPRYIKFGRKILYPMSEVEAFERLHMWVAVSVPVIATNERPSSKF